MINEEKNKLLSNIDYIDNKGKKNIEEALNYIIKMYDGVKNVNGEDFSLHPIRTAYILSELHSDSECIIASLLHSLPIKTDLVKEEDIKNKYGDNIYNIVESLLKINKLRLMHDDNQSSIYLRKIMVGLATDARVIIIKLAGRLDNLRNVYIEDTPRRKEVCKETQSVLIPIAHRLGINYLKSELEDLSLRYLKPDIYREIEENLNASRDELNGYIDTMKNSLSEIMESENIKFRIKGRVKSVHSLYEKLSKGKRMKDIYDVLALRIIVDKVSDCYTAIGLIHAKYRPLPKRFKDYIAQPKENMYQSLHTGVIGPNGQIFEVQIRTEEMDEIAECGIASHWSYKENGTMLVQSLMEQKLEIFRAGMENDLTDEEIKQKFNENFTESMIYVFTPKGDVLELPDGATPIDFAYRIHSHVGDTLVGAIVNDQIVPIDYKLKNDDIVKIRTNENSTPKKEWLNFVVTSQAKNKIKAFFSKQDREEYIKKGEEQLVKEIRKQKLVISDVLSEDNINKILKELKLKDIDELYLSIGSLRYTSNYVLNILDEDTKSVPDLILEKITSNTDVKKKDFKKNIIIAGCDDILVNTASCCMPVYGDDIVGYITKGNGVLVHKANCKNIKSLSTRLIEASWNNLNQSNYNTRLIIKTNNINNNLLDIVTKSSQRNLNIVSINTIKRGDEIDYELIIKVPDTKSLSLFMTDLESLPFVRKVER